MKFKDSFHPYAGITILFWSLAFVLTRLLLQTFSAFPLGFLRYTVASCALVVIVLTAKIAPPDKANLKWFLLSGFFGFFLYMITFNKGIESVTASTSSVVIATAPVITALLAGLFYREKLSTIQWTATAVEFSGVVLLSLMNKHLFVEQWTVVAAARCTLSGHLQPVAAKTNQKPIQGCKQPVTAFFRGQSCWVSFFPMPYRKSVLPRPSNYCISRSSVSFPARSPTSPGRRL